MPQRAIIGSVVDAGGVELTSGEFRVTPVSNTGGAGDGLVVQGHSYAIAGGRVMATVVVPGDFLFEIFDSTGARLLSFVANVSADTLANLPLRDLWASRVDQAPVTVGPLRDGDSVLRLAPGGGTAGAVLTHSVGGLRWSEQPNGDMRRNVYDPNQIGLDVFERANHTGTQPIATVAGLQDALDDTAMVSHTHSAADITSGRLDPARLGSGAASAATYLRGDGVWAPVSGVQWAEIYYEVGPSTHGQASVAGTWVTLLLNTFGINEIGATVASDGTISLPAGTYSFDVDASAFGCHENNLRLYNVTAGTTIRVGLTTRPISTHNMYQTSRLKATFVLAGASEIRVQHIAYQANAQGYGLAVGHYWSDFDLPEMVNVYTSVFIQRKT